MRHTTHRRSTLRTATVAIAAGAALLAPAAVALASTPAPQRAAAPAAAPKPVKIDIGAGVTLQVKGGKPYYNGKALKPGQTVEDGIYLHLSADGKKLYSKTQGGGTPYAIWDVKTGKSLGTQKTSPTAKVKAALTAKPSTTSVKAWQELRVSGKAAGIKAGTKVGLQQKQRGTWKSLPATTTVNKSGSYTLRVKLGLKGKNELRMKSGATLSPVFTVTVR
ncbi:hypothetical protein [Streptomyces flavofungini]|uniref:Uncharacterized protein n=1 Tax=Streptomyces flavofungini TaxID=68200 RepID=A0ABS0XBY8_9ACTN|nr:hypothetical protein [Streptomyces flavofungini]MBJ3810728.1 hypothetical protein [Streptomyces flavofungini]GHC51735.1 hypothetical protein GCM10010349_17020 [Streptomyces flavofungini]